MKPILIICLALLMSSTAPSNETPNAVMCASSGMWFWPEEGDIGPNSLFMVQGYARSQNEIEKLKTENIYLQSTNGELIPLELVEINKGDMQLTQAILKPSSPLKLDTTYEMVSKNKIKTKDNNKAYTLLDSRQPIWTVKAPKSTFSKNTPIEIKYKDSEYTLFGCGPSTHSIFTVTKNPTTEMWFKTELIDLTTNKSNSYYLTSKDGEISVGHGMCSGAFRYPNTGNYKVRFTPMTTHGTTLETTDWITFKNPSFKG